MKIIYTSKFEREYKKMPNHIKKSAEEKGMIGSGPRAGENNDIEALTDFVKEAHNNSVQTDRQHLVFMIGDGLGDEEMNDAALRLQKQYGVEIFGIIINNSKQGNEEQYPHAQKVDELDDLPQVIGSLLRRYLGKRII